MAPRDHVVNHGQAVIEKGSSSFAAASKLFDPTTRGRSHMLYAYDGHLRSLMVAKLL